MKATAAARKNRRGAEAFRPACTARHPARTRRARHRAKRLPGYGGECFEISLHGPSLGFEKFKETSRVESCIPETRHEDGVVRVKVVQGFSMRDELRIAARDGILRGFSRVLRKQIAPQYGFGVRQISCDQGFFFPGGCRKI